MAEVGGMEREIAHAAAYRSQFLMRQLEKVFQHAQLVHYLQGGRMHGVASKIAKEVAMLLENDNFYARSRQQVSQHDARRSAADHTAVSSQ